MHQLVLDKYERQQSLPLDYVVTQARFRRALEYLCRTYVPAMRNALNDRAVPEEDMKHIIMADNLPYVEALAKFLDSLA